MILAISYSIYIILFFLNVVFKKYPLWKNLKLVLKNNYSLKKFFYFYFLNYPNYTKLFHFKEMYKFKTYTSLPIDLIGIFISTCIKNSVYTHLEVNLLKIGVWLNLIVMKHKFFFFNKTYLLGSADSLTFFSNKLNLSNNHLLLFNLKRKLKYLSNTIVRKYILQSFKKLTFIKYIQNNLITRIIKKIDVVKWLIEYSTTTIEKFNDLNKIKQNTILFLRKNKIFNKGRYSRNRQYYRTGVYWCIYINVILVIGLYFWFYRFTMNFSYMWWALYLFITSFVFIKVIKLHLYNVFFFVREVKLTIQWMGKIIRNFFSSIYSCIFILIKHLNNFYAISFYTKRIKYFSFVELFIYPILFMFLQLKYWLLKFINLFTKNKYTNHSYTFFDYYILNTNTLFIIKAILVNLVKLRK